MSLTSFARRAVRLQEVGIPFAVGVEVRAAGGYFRVRRRIVSLRLREGVVPDLVAPLDVKLAVWGQLVLEQLRQVHDVVVGRLVRDVDPGVLAGQVRQLDRVLPGAPRDCVLEPTLLRGSGGQGAVRPVHLGGLVGGRIVHEPQHLERLKAGQEPARERLPRRVPGSHQLHVLHSPLRPGERQHQLAGRLVDHDVGPAGVARGVIGEARDLDAAARDRLHVRLAHERELVGAVAAGDADHDDDARVSCWPPVRIRRGRFVPRRAGTAPVACGLHRIREHERTRPVGDELEVDAEPHCAPAVAGFQDRRFAACPAAETEEKNSRKHERPAEDAISVRAIQLHAFASSPV